jgi:Dolichyl-phosphate-mannose-protein mannosyltransferase
VIPQVTMPAKPASHGFRELFLRALVWWGVALVAITELLSVFHALAPKPLLFCWLAFALAAVLLFRPRLSFAIPASARDPVVIFANLGAAAILILTALTAAYSPPNSADAMAYHMPRVVYWAEQSSVRFFPTPYFNQIMLQPLAEYGMLHTWLLTGGDRLVNFVQWFGSVGSIIGVSAVAGLMGAGARGQALASLFCATLPAGVLASSGAKNDYFLAMWLVCAIYFAARFARSVELRDALALGAALGLALLTKATAYLFAPWLLAAVFLPHAIRFSRRASLRATAALACAIFLGGLLNAPQYARNLELSGSILGFDSAHGDGFFRWRNETFGWKQTASNMLRNLSDQLGGRSETWNHQVYDWVVRAHHWLGIDVNDPATTWRWTTFEPPRNANHEANANSQWHLLILAIATGIAFWRLLRARQLQANDAGLALYSLALLCGYVAFCAYLKWQLYEARLFLPLLVAGSPLAGAALDWGMRPPAWKVPAAPRLLSQLLLCLFLLSTARRPATENWVRPLKGPRSVFRVSRDDQYFADLTQWNNHATYLRTVQLLAASGAEPVTATGTKPACHVIGIDASGYPLEYPLMALLRERIPGVLFVHTGVHNVSARFRPPVEAAPCAIVCLDCAGDRQRESLYQSLPWRADIDKFVIFRSDASQSIQ